MAIIYVQKERRVDTYLKNWKTYKFSVNRILKLLVGKSESIFYIKFEIVQLYFAIVDGV